jgi:CheY-like chemotaxis protein
MTARPLNILIVEDEPAIVSAIRFSLAAPDRAFSSAANGAEALARVESQEPPFDLVLTDNNMPHLNGLELVRGLRKRNFGGKIVVVSAHLTPEMQETYKELRVDGMLPKPFNVEDLRLLVKRVVQDS